MRVIGNEQFFKVGPTLKQKELESVTEFIITAESTAITVKAANKNVSDALLVAVVLKGFLEEFTPLLRLRNPNFFKNLKKL